MGRVVVPSLSSGRSGSARCRGCSGPSGGLSCFDQCRTPSAPCSRRRRRRHADGRRVVAVDRLAGHSVAGGAIRQIRTFAVSEVGVISDQSLCSTTNTTGSSRTAAKSAPRGPRLDSWRRRRSRRRRSDPRRDLGGERRPSRSERPPRRWSSRRGIRTPAPSGRATRPASVAPACALADLGKQRRRRDAAVDCPAVASVGRDRSVVGPSASAPRPGGLLAGTEVDRARDPLGGASARDKRLLELADREHSAVGGRRGRDAVRSRAAPCLRPSGGRRPSGDRR